MKARLRSLFLPALLLGILALLGLTGWGIYNHKRLPTALSTVAATLSALAALLISVRSQWREDSYRSADRAEESANRIKEREESELLRREAKKALTSLYAIEIDMWLRRKELLDLLNAVKRAARNMFTHKLAMKVMLFAKESMESTSKPEDVPEHFRQSMALSRERLVADLAMPSVRAVSAIPNIWTTQFKREDVHLLGGDALRYFLGMGTIWTNVGHMAGQIPPADDAIQFIFQNSSSDVEQYLGHLETFLEGIKAVTEQFIKLAVEGADILTKHSAASDALPPLPVLDSLLRRSQEASPGIVNLLQWISVGKSIELGKAAEQEFRRAQADFDKSSAATQEHLEELKASALAALGSLEQTQNLADRGLPLTAAPLPDSENK